MMDFPNPPKMFFNFSRSLDLKNSIHSLYQTKTNSESAVDLMRISIRLHSIYGFLLGDHSVSHLAPIGTWHLDIE